jgi:hypothetical protein
MVFGRLLKGADAYLPGLIHPDFTRTHHESSVSTDNKHLAGRILRDLSAHFQARHDDPDLRRLLR